jgi:hypothetical protein
MKRLLFILGVTFSVVTSAYTFAQSFSGLDAYRGAKFARGVSLRSTMTTDPVTKVTKTVHTFKNAARATTIYTVYYDPRTQLETEYAVSMDSAGNITGKGKYVQDMDGSREAQFMDAAGKIRASQSRKMKSNGDKSVLYKDARGRTVQEWTHTTNAEGYTIDVIRHQGSTIVQMRSPTGKPISQEIRDGAGNISKMSFNARGGYTEVFRDTAGNTVVDTRDPQGNILTENITYSKYFKMPETYVQDKADNIFDNMNKEHEAVGNSIDAIVEKSWPGWTTDSSEWPKDDASKYNSRR